MMATAEKLWVKATLTPRRQHEVAGYCSWRRFPTAVPFPVEDGFVGPTPGDGRELGEQGVAHRRRHPIGFRFRGCYGGGLVGANRRSEHDVA